LTETSKPTGGAGGSEKPAGAGTKPASTKLGTRGDEQSSQTQSGSPDPDIRTLEARLATAEDIIEGLANDLREVRRELTSSRQEALTYRKIADDNADLLRIERTRVVQLAAQIDVVTTLEGITESVHTLDATLKSTLSPLTVLDRLGSPGTPIKQDAIDRLKAIQASALRFADESYNVHRAVVASPPPAQITTQYW
jgi:hypothetical protein